MFLQKNTVSNIKRCHSRCLTEFCDKISSSQIIWINTSKEKSSNGKKKYENDITRNEKTNIYN